MSLLTPSANTCQPSLDMELRPTPSEKGERSSILVAAWTKTRHVNKEDGRQQRLWPACAAEVVASVCTRLAPREVKEQIMKVGATTSLMRELHLRVQKLAATPDLAAAGDGKMAWALLNLVESHLHGLSTRVLFETQTPKYFKGLIKHADSGVSATAARLYTTIHADWMAQQAAKRRKKE